jgi:hypothetical protein
MTIKPATARTFLAAAMSYPRPGCPTPTIEEVWNMCHAYNINPGVMSMAAERYNYIVDEMGFSTEQGVIATLYFLGHGDRAGIDLGDNDYE